MDVKTGEVNAVLDDIRKAIAHAERLTVETGQKHEVRIEVTIFEIVDDDDASQQQQSRERGGER